MKLKNPFKKEDREWFRDYWACWKCGQNGTQSGGLELNHITGRDSNSILNASILCNGCHTHIGHTQEEERELFEKTLNYLMRRGYKLTEKDEDFIRQHPYLVINFVK